MKRWTSSSFRFFHLRCTHITQLKDLGYLIRDHWNKQLIFSAERANWDTFFFFFLPRAVTSWIQTYQRTLPHSPGLWSHWFQEHLKSHIMQPSVSHLGTLQWCICTNNIEKSALLCCADTIAHSEVIQLDVSLYEVEVSSVSQWY